MLQLSQHFFLNLSPFDYFLTVFTTTRCLADVTILVIAFNEADVLNTPSIIRSLLLNNIRPPCSAWVRGPGNTGMRFQHQHCLEASPLSQIRIWWLVGDRQSVTETQSHSHWS